MARSASISRLSTYYSRHGVGPTLRRLGLAARRALFTSRMVLFYCDLGMQNSRLAHLPGSFRVERKRQESELNKQDLDIITTFWNPEVSRRNVKERFALGASLWLIKSNDCLAGYGWSLRGCTVEPHYFRLTQHDVHFFDFYVFPQYRGRGVNPTLVRYMLHSLIDECRGHAFIEAAEWNEAQLASLRRTPFCRLGSARKFTLFRRTMVCWDNEETVDQERPNDLKSSSMAATRSAGSSIPAPRP